MIKATGGYYYVETGTGPDTALVECRARGIFRKEGRSPYVGDMVDIQLDGDGVGTVNEIHPRKNDLIRPPLANLDYMVVVISVADPPFNAFVTDKFLAILEHKDIEPLIAITKSDLGDSTAIQARFRKAGYPVFAVHTQGEAAGQGVSELKDALAGRLCAFSGNSGVGKSSLLNAIDPHFQLETGDISKKLGRGRHTTRHVELFQLDNGALIADTPGFSTVEVTRMSAITKESLAWCFRDMEPYLEQCKFTDCSHTTELGCAVLAAVAAGDIDAGRHESYMQLYSELKDLKEWEQ
ncbi:ribosome small subunit-dependent GTPase A [Ruminococcaceae bacterium OttesenSCG-928-L11]|nr:ribosome small subunit-dependent GTPase A [Ruminococcaceae bacterium OttesenSCG-928-L11]